MVCINPISFRGDVRSLGGDGSFHEEDQADQGQRNDGEDKERIEVGESGRLCGTKIVEGLQCHLFRGDRIACLLEKERLRLVEV